MLKTLILTAGALLSLSAQAAPILVNGNLSDWNVTLQDSIKSAPASVFNTVKAPAGAKLLGYAVEDQDDLAGAAGYLGPHYGGQNYDVEFMAVAYQGGKIFLSIATGQRPDNGKGAYSPGDIRIVDNKGKVYGIEVGGGTGNDKAKQGAINEGAAGTTYKLDANGNTVSVANAAAAQTAGSIWSDVKWITSPIAGDTTPVQFEIGSGSKQLGNTDFVYTLDAMTTQHAVIELSFDLALFKGVSSLDFFWAPSCDNDFLLVHTDVSKLPEPGSLALLGLGLAGLMLRRRRAS